MVPEANFFGTQLWLFDTLSGRSDCAVKCVLVQNDILELKSVMRTIKPYNISAALAMDAER